MPGFRYQAYNLEGKLHKGVLEADSARQARSLLRDQGLTPYRVEVIAANDPAAGARFRPVSLSSTQVAQLTRGLASLLFALGIRLVGDRAARLLARHFGSMDALMKAAEGDSLGGRLARSEAPPAVPTQK